MFKWVADDAHPQGYAVEMTAAEIADLEAAQAELQQIEANRPPSPVEHVLSIVAAATDFDSAKAALTDWLKGEAAGA